MNLKHLLLSSGLCLALFLAGCAASVPATDQTGVSETAGDQVSVRETAEEKAVAPAQKKSGKKET